MTNCSLGWQKGKGKKTLSTHAYTHTHTRLHTDTHEHEFTNWLRFPFPFYFCRKLCVLGAALSSECPLGPIHFTRLHSANSSDLILMSTLFGSIFCPLAADQIRFWKFYPMLQTSDSTLLEFQLAGMPVSILNSLMKTPNIRWTPARRPLRLRRCQTHYL